MPKRGENITKRKDGRWEARLLISHNEQGKAVYRYLYGKSYTEVKNKKQENLQSIQESSQSYSQPIMIGEIMTEYLLSEKNCVKVSTYARYKAIIEKHLRPIFNEVPVKSINNNMISGFINSKLTSGQLDGLGGLSPKRVKDILMLLKSTLNYALKQGYTNRSFLFPMPRQNNKEIEVFTTEEQKVLIEYAITAGDSQRFGIVLCLYSGLRIGELCALRWCDINTDTLTIQVQYTLQRVSCDAEGRAKTKIIVDEPKTKLSQRIVPIPDCIIPILMKQRALSLSKTSYVLTGTNHYIEPSNYYVKFQHWLLENGVRQRSFHALRHTFATNCIENGFDPKSLSEILGHSNVKITLDRYVHPSVDLKRKNMNRLTLPLSSQK